jgi:hypothetical protein
MFPLFPKRETAAPWAGRWMRAYYALTPVFFVVDFFCGANVRAAGFDGHPGFRIFYYLLCGGCALLMRRRPDWAPALSIGESGINLTALFVAFFNPYWALLEAVSENAEVPTSLWGPEYMVNFMLAASAAISAFYARTEEWKRTHEPS